MNSSTFTQQSQEQSSSEFNLIENESGIGQTIYERKSQLKEKTQFYLKLALMLAAINLLIIINSFGQLVTFNNVTITNTSQVTVKGDMLNNAGTVITNNGTIDMTGNLTNNSGSNLFGTSSGNVTLNGANQNICGVDVITFNNLSLAGTGIKTMQQDVITGGTSATGILALDNKILDLNSHLITVTNSNPSAITTTGGYIVSETSPVSGYGTVKWMIQNNTGLYVYPFGNAVTNSYVPVSIEVHQAGTGSNGYISLATYPTRTDVAPNNRPLPTGLTSLMDIYGNDNSQNVVDRFWEIDAANYTVKPISSIVFSYRESEWNSTGGSTNVITESLLQAQSNDGTMWSPQSIGNVNVNTNTVTVSGISAYNRHWTIVGSSNPLPMTLLSFDAVLNKKEEVELEWATATEINNDYFTVEKSKDGETFEPLAVVDGAGNSTNVLNYQSKDRHPFEGVTYYRLRQTDFDGNYTYSEIKTVNLKKVSMETFQVFPNPATDHFFVKFEEETPEQSLFIMDINGKVIREINMNEVESVGASLIKIDRLSLEAGMYLITTSEGNMQKLILQ